MLRLWFAYVRLTQYAAVDIDRESANVRLGLWILALGVLDVLHALPAIGGGSARVLVGTIFFSAYAGWTSMPAVHHAYANLMAMASVPHGDAYQVVSVESNAMAPAVAKGSFAVVDFSAYLTREPRVGDVVAVVVPPHRFYLKRLVAMPGDTFEVTGTGVLTNGRRPRGWRNRAYPNYELEVGDDTIEVNGVPLDRSIASIPLPSAWPDASRLPDDCYFVLGDNINDSEDSHDFGCVPRSAIIGRVLASL
jgi:signal peptidase I